MSSVEHSTVPGERAGSRPRRARSGLVDSRLVARVPATRPLLVTAVVVGLATTASVVVQAALLASIINAALRHGASLDMLSSRLAGLGVAFGARAGFLWVGELITQRTSVAVTGALRGQLLRRALTLGPTWLADERAGELSLTTTRGISALTIYFGNYLPQAVLAVLAPLGIIAWLFGVDWISALVLSGIVAVVPIALVVLGKRAAAETDRQWRRLTSLSARFLELIQGLPTLRALGRADHGRREVSEATDGLRRTTMATLRIAFLSAFSMELLSGLGVGLVAMVLGLRLLAGGIGFATALAVLLVSPEVLLPLRRAGAEFHASAEGQAAAQRILDILDLDTAQEPQTASKVAADLAHKPLAVEGLSIVYPGRIGAAVEHFDLLLEPGEHVALVGPSGSGKSTVLAALLGFLAPTTGSIRVGGVSLEAGNLETWRRQITWVPQRPHLFSGSIGDNLRFGDPEASDDRLRWAIELAGLSRYVEQLPEGLATPLGEGGLPVSAGERQRLAIARALLRDAPIVLLDEPAAHLDSTTESQLRDALAEWFDRRTVLIAAHRPEVVSRIDRVVALQPTPSGHHARGIGR